MKTLPLNHLTNGPASALRSFIAYDDFAAGERGRAFASALSNTLGAGGGSNESLWRLDLFAEPGNADELAHTAANSDFVILSLRGDRELPDAAWAWLKAWLPLVGDRQVNLMAIFEGAHQLHVRSIRRELREMAGEAGVEFFTHTTNTPAARTVPEESENERQTEEAASGRVENARRCPASFAA
ncbi:MAG: hypothetical protein ABMA13_05990 [Chthoniobacteraceae bacterium]